SHNNAPMDGLIHRGQIPNPRELRGSRGPSGRTDQYRPSNGLMRPPGLILVTGAFLLFFFTLLYDGHVMSHRTSGNRTDDSMMICHMTGNAANDSTFETTRLDGIDCRRSENKNRCGAKGDLSYHPFTSTDFPMTPELLFPALSPGS